MSPWDNWTVDGLLWAAAIVLLVAALIRWGPRLVNRDGDLWEPHPPVSEPIRHVHVPPSEMEDALHLSIYNSYRGQLGHTPFCRSGDGQELTCECEVAS